MRFLLDLAWRDLRASGRSLWIFCACLALGVTLVSASGGLHRLISLGLLADTRNLMGGDLEVDTNQALPEPVLQWMNSNGEVSLVTEMYTMLGTEDGNFLRVELQSMDARYPLYGKLRLEPEQATRCTANSGSNPSRRCHPPPNSALAIGGRRSIPRWRIVSVSASATRFMSARWRWRCAHWCWSNPTGT
jgi:predicted lysophospholipase L1 biosynthesis ABC-type transport system permease subunit